MLWQTREQVTATSAPFSRNQLRRLFIQSELSYLKAVELSFNYKGLPWMNYYENKSIVFAQQYCMCNC